jgi:hypothetical protein
MLLRWSPIFLLPISVFSAGIPVDKSQLMGLGIQALNKGSDLIYGGAVPAESEDGTVKTMSRWTFEDCGKLT